MDDGSTPFQMLNDGFAVERLLSRPSVTLYSLQNGGEAGERRRLDSSWRSSLANAFRHHEPCVPNVIAF